MARKKRTVEQDVNTIIKTETVENKNKTVEVEKKVETPKVQEVEEDEIPTNNQVLLRNRYDKAMKEVDEVLSSEQKKKEYFSQKIFKFKFV
jgi:hypothetical protein